MTPSRFQRPCIVATATRRQAPLLKFAPLTVADIPAIMPFLPQAHSRTCDFTVGGLLMWTQYFSYSYAICRDTLFIKGVTEDDVTRPAFSLPVGKMGLEEAVALLRHYCRINGDSPLTFSAVPEVYVEPLRLLGASEITPLEDWSDYLYDIEALSSLSGKHLSKKRNHVNRFMADNPAFEFTPLTSANAAEVERIYSLEQLPLSKPALADVEREQVMEVLRHLDAYPFEGAVLSTPSQGIVAFTLGEVIGDTLYVHIEKMRHDVAGAGETINKLFAARMAAEHPGLAYVNREEDVGDPGLRYAKTSYHPCMLLRKFNVRF